MGARLHKAAFVGDPLAGLSLDESDRAGVVAWALRVTKETGRTVVIARPTTLHVLDEGESAETVSLLTPTFADASGARHWEQSGADYLGDFTVGAFFPGIILARLCYFAPVADLVIVTGDESIGIAFDFSTATADKTVSAVVELEPSLRPKKARQFWE